MGKERVDRSKWPFFAREHFIDGEQAGLRMNTVDGDGKANSVFRYTDDPWDFYHEPDNDKSLRRTYGEHCVSIDNNSGFHRFRGGQIDQEGIKIQSEIICEKPTKGYYFPEYYKRVVIYGGLPTSRKYCDDYIIILLRIDMNEANISSTTSLGKIRFVRKYKSEYEFRNSYVCEKKIARNMEIIWHDALVTNNFCFNFHTNGRRNWRLNDESVGNFASEFSRISADAVRVTSRSLTQIFSQRLNVWPLSKP